MLTIADLMEPEVITVAPGLSLRDVVELLAYRHISGAPVVEGTRLVGVVSASDVMTLLASLPVVPSERTDFLEQGEVAPAGEWEEGEEAPSAYFTDLWQDTGADFQERIQRLEGPEWDILEEHTVAEAMTRSVATLPMHSDVATAARFFMERKIHRAVVTDHGAVRGILTTTDLVRAVADGRLVAARPTRS